MNNIRIRFDYLNNGTEQVNPVDGVATTDYLKITSERFADDVLPYEKKIFYMFRTAGNTSPIKFMLNGTYRSRVASVWGGYNNFSGIIKYFVAYVEDESSSTDRNKPSIVFYQRPKIIKNGNVIEEQYDIEIFGDCKFQNKVMIGNKNVGDAIGAITYSSNNEEGKSNEVLVNESNSIPVGGGGGALNDDDTAVIFDAGGNAINTGIVNPATDFGNQFVNDLNSIGNGIGSLF